MQEKLISIKVPIYLSYRMVSEIVKTLQTDGWISVGTEGDEDSIEIKRYTEGIKIDINMTIDLNSPTDLSINRTLN